MIPEKDKEIIKNYILNEQGFIKAVFSGHRYGIISTWTKVVLRPVFIKNSFHIQFVYFTKEKNITKNFNGIEVLNNLQLLFDLPFKNIHIATQNMEIQITISKKGKVLLHRSKTQTLLNSELQHDRTKNYLLSPNDHNFFLQTIGIMNTIGKIKSERQKKFKQINEFLKILKQTNELENFKKQPIEIVDYGCGNAYLSFATYYFLNDILRLPARLAGVDLNIELIDKHQKTADILGWHNINFKVSAATDYKPLHPSDITLALHACDTATDEAISQGIKLGSKLILSVPCCHQDIQKQISKLTNLPVEFNSLLRHGIFKERLGDILTDTFRALLLRIMGYKTEVIQFISSEHTAKNIMIKAVYVDKQVPLQSVYEYKQLKEYWKVTPYLEQILGENLQNKLATVETSNNPALYNS